MKEPQESISEINVTIVKDSAEGATRKDKNVSRDCRTFNTLAIFNGDST